MADAGCFERVAAIVESPSLTSSAALGRGRAAIVVSACKGVTDELLALVALAERQDAGWRARLDTMRARAPNIWPILIATVRTSAARCRPPV